MRRLCLALSLFAVMTPTIAAARHAVPAAVPDGEPRDCLPITSLRSSAVRSDSVIDFYTRGGQVYRNTLPQPCPQLGFEESFTYQTSISQLCSVDIINVLYGPNLQRGAGCGLGKFAPVKLVPAAR